MAKEIVAVTGGTGFIGGHLISRLQEGNIDVRTLIRHNEVPVTYGQNITGDLETGEGLEELLDGVDMVINLVGKMQPPFKDLVSLNAIVLDNLCQIAIKKGVKKLIHISTAGVYGIPRNNRPFIEKDIPMPDTLYGLSKLLGEQIISFYQRSFKLPIIILRPSNIYGPGSDHGVVYNLIKSQKEIGKVIIHGNGTQKRDFLYVEDMVDAIIKCLDYDSSWGIFNISTNEPKDLNELVATLGKVLEVDIKVEYQGEGQGPKLVSASFAKAKRLLKWEPKTSLEVGLKKTLQTL